MRIIDASPSDRLIVVAAILTGYGFAFAPLLIFGPGGTWWAAILGKGGSPFLILAVLCGAVFAPSIIAHPWRWGISASAIAVLMSTAGLWFLLNESLVGLFVLFPALIAPVAFRGALTIYGR